MKRLIATALLLSAAFAASAQTVVPATSEAMQPQPAAVAPAVPLPNQDRADAKKDINDRNCLRYTGSRLINADRKGRKCAIAAGRSYDREDIDRTGAYDLTDAIRKLDPSIR